MSADSQTHDRPKSTGILLGVVAACVASTLAVSCSYRPARFENRPPVLIVRDDTPIAVPAYRRFFEELYVSDGYLKRPILDGLDPTRFPEAGDVNSFDEVPQSSWFQPPPGRNEPVDVSMVEDGPPVLPLSVVQEPAGANDYGISVIDARGLRYELRRDPKDRPEMETGAAAISARLLRAFGLLTPEVWVFHARPTDFLGWSDEEREKPSDLERWPFLANGPPGEDGRFRMSATRWPIGEDVGLTPVFDTRSDDPNDQIPHMNRRSLRALKVVGAWLQMGNVGPKRLRDVYVGKPPVGHLMHFIVRLESDLGANSVVRPAPTKGLRTDLGPGTVKNFFSLGFWPSSDASPTQTRWLALGGINDDASPETFSAAVGFAPTQRLLPGDGYWAAKRIAKIPAATIQDAVRAAQYTDPVVRDEMIRILGARRDKVAAYWFSQVTPCECKRVLARTVVIHDEAIGMGFARPESTRYTVSVLNDDGDEMMRPLLVLARSADFEINIPGRLRKKSERIVLRIRAIRKGKPLPRACDIHLVPLERSFRLNGVRH